MDKSTKKIFSTVWPIWPLKISLSEFEVVVGVCVKNHTWTKNAGNFMKWINPLKIFVHCLTHLAFENFIVRVWGGGGGGVCEKSHLNQKCRKFHEMDKSTKNFFVHCLAHLDLENFVVRVWGGGGGVCEKSHLNQKWRKFHEMAKSTKKFFSLFGPFGFRKFCHQSLRWWWEGCEKSHLNQKCRKFHEIDKSTKKIFVHCLAHLDLENFVVRVWGGGGGGGGMWKITPEPKMQEISWNG